MGARQVSEKHPCGCCLHIIDRLLIEAAIKVGSAIRVDDDVGIGCTQAHDDIMRLIGRDDGLADVDALVQVGPIAFDHSHAVMEMFEIAFRDVEWSLQW